LEKKGFTSSEIQGVIGRLREEGLLDDARFARDWTQSRVLNKLWGRERVREELTAKGINLDLIVEAIQEVYSEHPEQELAFQAARKKWRSLTTRDPLKARQKVGSYLQRQGFPFEMIIKALDNLKD